MRRSKLDLYVSVLNAIVIHGSLNVTGLTLRARLNYAQLKPIINSLIDKDVIQEKRGKNSSVVYVATALGQRLSTQFKRMEESQTALKQSKQNMIEMLIS